MKPLSKNSVFSFPAQKKPYHESPSHKKFDRVIFEIAELEDVHIVTFGTCGITPRELDMQYPFMHYSFMMGKCNVVRIKRDFIKLESERIAAYLKKTRKNYIHRIAYCIGDFRIAMEKALKMVDIEVNVIPRRLQFRKCFNPQNPSFLIVSPLKSTCKIFQIQLRCSQVSQKDSRYQGRSFGR